MKKFSTKNIYNNFQLLQYFSKYLFGISLDTDFFLENSSFSSTIVIKKNISDFLTKKVEDTTFMVYHKLMLQYDNDVKVTEIRMLKEEDFPANIHLFKVKQ